jgi:hypothetical protein
MYDQIDEVGCSTVGVDPTDSIPLGVFTFLLDLWNWFTSRRSLTKGALTGIEVWQMDHPLEPYILV